MTEVVNAAADGDVLTATHLETLLRQYEAEIARLSTIDALSVPPRYVIDCIEAMRTLRDLLCDDDMEDMLECELCGAVQ